eukprot:scaffold869_cov303-Pinguiococcus_pyrenoidosus.AAC.28
MACTRAGERMWAATEPPASPAITNSLSSGASDWEDWFCCCVTIQETTDASRAPHLPSGSRRCQCSKQSKSKSKGKSKSKSKSKGRKSQHHSVFWRELGGGREGRRGSGLGCSNLILPAVRRDDHRVVRVGIRWVVHVQDSLLGDFVADVRVAQERLRGVLVVAEAAASLQEENHLILVAAGHDLELVLGAILDLPVLAKVKDTARWPATAKHRRRIRGKREMSCAPFCLVALLCNGLDRLGVLPLHHRGVQKRHAPDGALGRVALHVALVEERVEAPFGDLIRLHEALALAEDLGIPSATGCESLVALLSRHKQETTKMPHPLYASSSFFPRKSARAATSAAKSTRSIIAAGEVTPEFRADGREKSAGKSVRTRRSRFSAGLWLRKPPSSELEANV